MRDRETYPISEGLSPLRRHGHHGPEGKTFSHLGRRSRKKKKKGGSLPLASGGAGTPPEAIIISAIYTNTSAIFTNISITFPPLSKAVHSPTTRLSDFGFWQTLEVRTLGCTRRSLPYRSMPNLLA